MCSNLFSALRPAQREKSLLQHELVQFIIVSRRIWGASRRGDLTEQAEQDTRPPGLRGFHLQNQQVWGCIPLLRAGSARGGGGCLVPTSHTSAADPAPSKKLGGGSLPSESHRAVLPRGSTGGQHVRAAVRSGDATQRGTQLCQRRGHGSVGLGRSQLPLLPRSWWEGTDVPQLPIPTAGICRGEAFGVQK